MGTETAFLSLCFFKCFCLISLLSAYVVLASRYMGLHTFCFLLAMHLISLA